MSDVVTHNMRRQDADTQAKASQIFFGSEKSLAILQGLGTASASP